MTFVNLYSILAKKSHGRPKMLNKKVSEDTRGPSSIEVKDRDNALQYVAIYEELLEDCIKNSAAALGHVEINETTKPYNPLRAYLDPELTELSGCPPVINSEEDVRAWYGGVLGQPAVLAINAMRESKKHPNGVSQDVNHDSWKKMKPWTASASGTPSPIPDLLIVDEVRDENVLATDVGSVVATVELKTENSYGKGEAFKHLLEQQKRYAAKLDEKKLLAFPFAWPTKADRPSKSTSGTPAASTPLPPNIPDLDDPIPRLLKQSKLLLQVYYQMLTYKVDYAILSCYTHAVFVYRMEHALILSKEYTIDAQELPSTLTAGLVTTWYLQACDKGVTMKIPDIDTEVVKAVNKEKKIKGLDVNVKAWGTQFDITKAYVDKKVKG